MLRLQAALGSLAALLVTGCLDPGEEVASSSAAVSVTWTNAVGVTPSGNDLSKSSGTTGWNAGAVSVETLLGDGFVEFTTGEANTSKMAGLSVGDSGQGRADIDFAIHLKPNGTVGVYEAGVLRGGNFTSYAAGDLLRVEAKAGVVRYSKNGAAFYSSSVPPGSPLGVDTSLNTPGATLLDVELVSTSIHWQNLIAVAAAGDDLSKTGTDAAWTAGASSVETLTSDGFVEFTASEATTLRMAGLGNGDASAHFSDIEYGIRLKANGVVGIYENGVERVLNAGTYLPGDTFRVTVSGGVVTYRMNGGPPLYTSQVAPTFPLRVDTSLHTPGATITNVRLVEAGHACPAYQGDGPVCEGSYTVENTLDEQAIVNCARITGNLTVLAPGMTKVSLPNLQRVDGNISLSGNTTLQAMNLSGLREIGGRFDNYSSTPKSDLSQLRSLGSMETVNALYAPCLDSVITDLHVWNAAIDAPRLRTVGGSMRDAVSMNVPALTSVVGDLTGGPPIAPFLATVGGELAVSSADLPFLSSVGGDLHGGPLIAEALSTVGGTVRVNYSLSAPALVTIGGTLYYEAGTSLPSVRVVGALSIQAAPTIELPALVEVEGQLIGGPGPCFEGTPVASSLSLPALERVGSMMLCFDSGSTTWGLADLSLPSLKTVTGPQVVKNGISAGLYIGPGGQLSQVEFPQLGLVRGSVEVHHPLSAPVLNTITRDLNLKHTPTVSLPALTTVGGLEAYKAFDLQTVDLPLLASVNRPGGVAFTKTQLTTLSLPSLPSLMNDLWIRDNTLLTTIDFPSLTSVGNLLWIEDNQNLPTCQVDSLVSQLRAAGWTGTAIILNNGTGPCP